MIALVATLMTIAYASRKDTVKIVIDSLGSQHRFTIIGDPHEDILLESESNGLNNIALELDAISKENECDDYSSDTLDLRIMTENTKQSKKRWVRSGPIYPYGEERIKTLISLARELNPRLRPNKIYKIQYLKYCKSKNENQ